MCTAELELVLKQVISHRMHILRDRSFLVIDLIYILMNVVTGWGLGSDLSSSQKRIG